MLLSINLDHGIYRYETFINPPGLIILTHTDFPKCHAGHSGTCMVLWRLFAQLAQIFCLPNRTLTCKLKLNGYTAVEQHKLLHFNCLLFRKWHNTMKCLDSGHDSSLLCSFVLKTRYEISETHSCFLTFKKTCNYCFRTALLSEAHFQVFVSTQGTENCTISTADRVSAHTFRETADYLPVVEKMPFTLLLSLPHFTSHSMVRFAYRHPFSDDILQYPLLRFHKVKSIHLHVPDRLLLLQGAQLWGQLSGSAHPFSGFLYRRLFLSASQILLPWPLQALFDLETRPVSLCLLGILSDAVTSLPRHCTTMGVVHLSLQYRKKCADPRQI